MRTHASTLLLLTLTAAQMAYSWQVRGMKPNMDIVPPAPRAEGVEAVSLGDSQVFFRILALTLQNSGDGFGRFTPLKNYDYGKLAQWFTLLDRLDPRSDMIAAMAAYYFAQTQNTPDVRYVVDYLYAHAMKDPAHKWWWMIQAIYLSMHKLNDMELALKVAQPLLHPDVPAWAQQLVAVVHEKRGEMDDALSIMEAIKDNAKHITDQDLRFMQYFITERLHALDKKLEKR